MTHVDAHDPATRDRSIQLGAVVRIIRMRAGMTQELLAEKAGCDRQSINRVENAVFAPALPRIFRVADALGVHPTVLFTDWPWTAETDQRWSPARGACSANLCRVDAAAKIRTSRGGERLLCTDHLANWGRRIVGGQLQVLDVGDAR